MKKLFLIILLTNCYIWTAQAPVLPGKDEVKKVMLELPPRISGNTAYTAFQLVGARPYGFHCLPIDETGRNRYNVAELMCRFPGQKQQILDHVIEGYQQFIRPDGKQHSI